MTTVGYLTTVCVRQFCLKKKLPQKMPCCCSLAFPHMQKQPSLSIIYTLTTHHHIHMFFLSSCPALKNKKMRSRKVLKSLCRRASSSSSSSTKHTRRLSCGGRKRKKKQPPQTTPIACNICLFVYFPVPFSLCSLFPWFGSIRLVPHAYRDDCEALEFPEKNRGKRKQQ